MKVPKPMNHFRAYKMEQHINVKFYEQKKIKPTMTLQMQFDSITVATAVTAVQLQGIKQTLMSITVAGFLIAGFKTKYM